MLAGGVRGPLLLILAQTSVQNFFGRLRGMAALRRRGTRPERLGEMRYLGLRPAARPLLVLCLTEGC